jgi:hypothetical protein
VSNRVLWLCQPTTVPLALRWVASTPVLAPFLAPFFSAFLAILLALAHTGAWAQTPQASAAYGIQFVCTPAQLERVQQEMPRYLQSLDIAPALVRTRIDTQHSTATYALAGASTDSSTLYLAWRPELGIRDDVVALPSAQGQQKMVETVSKKEIVLTLLHPGRLTTLRGRACDVQALVDHVGIRQNTVLWAQELHWKWPDGGSAYWNRPYWDAGTPQPGVPLRDALNDLFFNQDRYAIGCYTATKMVYAQAVLDYYARVKANRVAAARVSLRLLGDNEPLVDIEPARMWSFESDFDPAERGRPGKLLRLLDGVATNHFVPGDWVYILNTDERTYQKTGYEGSNAIYLGRNRFDDYYNDNVHHYSFKEKLGEVYQWRHGVFSRSRDYAKRQPLASEDYERLSATPERGGLVLGYRAVPYFFGFERLPPMNGLPPPQPTQPQRASTN